MPDRKLAAKRAARGQSSSGSVPLGAFLNVLSHKEGTKKKPVPPEENVGFLFNVCIHKYIRLISCYECARVRSWFVRPTCGMECEEGSGVHSVNFQRLVWSVFIALELCCLLLFIHCLLSCTNGRGVWDCSA